MQAAGHGRRLGGTEVAGVEGGDVRRGERLELVDGDGLAVAVRPGLVETVGAVEGGEGVIGEDP